MDPTKSAIFIHIKVGYNKWAEFLYKEDDSSDYVLTHVIVGLTDNDIDYFLNLIEEYKKSKEG